MRSGNILHSEELIKEYTAMRKPANILQHPKRKFILLNILAAVVILFLIIFIVLQQLDNYTRHNQYITVPSFEGMTQDDAKALAQQHKLRISIIDSLYNEDVQAGNILEQNPRTGTQVKQNRMIHLTINASGPDKISFPNLQNTAYRQTLQTLENNGFRIGQISYAPSEFKNLVLYFTYKGNNIEPGTVVDKGSVINIVLGSGYDESNTVFIPNLSGKTIKEATRLLQYGYLNVGKIIPDKTITSKYDQQAGIIYQQEPSGESTVTSGTAVNLYITLNKERVRLLDSLMIKE